jgi:hypothetical protein
MQSLQRLNKARGNANVDALLALFTIAALCFILYLDLTGYW